MSRSAESLPSEATAVRAPPRSAAGLRRRRTRRFTTTRPRQRLAVRRVKQAVAPRDVPAQRGALHPPAHLVAVAGIHGSAHVARHAAGVSSRAALAHRDHRSRASSSRSGLPSRQTRAPLPAPSARAGWSRWCASLGGGFLGARCAWLGGILNAASVLPERARLRGASPALHAGQRRPKRAGAVRVTLCRTQRRAARLRTATEARRALQRSVRLW